jgi:hypothetical protein
MTRDLLAMLAQRRVQFRGGSGATELWEEGVAEPLPTGLRLLLDFGTQHGGLVKWPPGMDFSGLQPLLDGEWPTFVNAPPYVGAVAMWALVEGVGVVPFISSAKGALTALGSLYARYRKLPEATRDLLPVLRIEEPTPYTPKANPAGRVFAPSYAPLGWLPRPSLFGPRTVPLSRVVAAPERRQAPTDRLFDETARTGSVLLPPHVGFVDEG